ncbi:MerR family DNA-binding transcriptional regulator [Bacillus anthracis]
MKQYKPKEFSEMLNVSVKTLQRWDNQGVLPAKRKKILYRRTV